MTEPMAGRASRRRRPGWRVALTLTAALIAIPAVVLASHQFTDVPTTHSFHTQIGAIKDAGITGGCTATTYCPASNVTRGQMAAFMHRGFGRAANSSSGYTYPEIDELDGLTTVESVTISVPGVTGGTQFVSVSGHVTAWDFANAECPCEADVWLYDVTNGDYSLPTFAYIGPDAGGSGGAIPISAVFPAIPGSHTYELQIQMFGNATDAVYVDFTSLTATTFPFGSTGGNTALSATEQVVPGDQPASGSGR